MKESNIVNIELLNENIRNCSQCRLYETRTNALCGEGNVNAKLMLIAQAPGKIEDRENKMFIGPSGQVLDEVLGLVNINREEIYLTNLIKCMLPNYRKPKKDEMEICGTRYLEKEIQMINPAIIAPLGYHSIRYIFKKYSLSLPSKQDIFAIFGKLFWTGTRKILPLPHPVTVVFNPSYKEEMLQYYLKLRVVRKNCKWYPVCPMKRFYEAKKLGKEWIELYCQGDWDSCVRYHLEEKGEFHPDHMLPDGSIDESLIMS